MRVKNLKADAKTWYELKIKKSLDFETESLKRLLKIRKPLRSIFLSSWKSMQLITIPP
jgi:hypothetical protein